ncbi:MAG: hypothetical protein FWG65_02460 [Turicibacter sp.]|nr:hypothetical protein [Turicibacter sp.]
MRKRKRLITHEGLIQVLESDPQELVKFVNAIFQTNHDPETAEVKFLQTKMQQFSDAQGTIGGSMATDLKADLIFSVNGVIYQIEVQTQHDNTMLVRLVEYQLNGLIANLHELQLDSKHKTSISLPQMALIAIDKSDQVPDFYEVEYIDTHTQGKLVQKFPVIKLWEQSVQSLSQDGKKLMLPFLINRYKKAFVKNPKDEQAARDFVKDSREISDTLNKLAAEHRVSSKSLHIMRMAQVALTNGFLNEYIDKNNPARKEVEDMIVFEERERTKNSADLLIEQGKAELQPIVKGLEQTIQTLLGKIQASEQARKKEKQAMRLEQQAREKVMRLEQQAREETMRLEQQAREEAMQKQIAELQAQVSAKTAKNHGS